MNAFKILNADNFHLQPSRGQWRIVFFISSAVYLFGMIVYLIFGSGMEQDWSRDGLEKKRSVYSDEVREEDPHNEYYSRINRENTGIVQRT